MTTITKLKSALAALQKNGEHLPVDFDYHFEAMEDLRSVIAEMEAGEPAFYGFMLKDECRVGICYTPGAPGGPNNELPTAYYTHPQPKVKPVQEPHKGCACRWDADDNRVATCERHQGWLDVVQEWADRARAAEAAAPQAMPVQEPVKFLANGMRFKLTGSAGCAASYIGFPPELGGRWVALVAAEDNCHLAAAPQAKPLTDEEIDRIVDEITSYKGEYPHAIARAIEAAHGIKP